MVGRTYIPAKENAYFSFDIDSALLAEETNRVRKELAESKEYGVGAPQKLIAESLKNLQAQLLPLRKDGRILDLYPGALVIHHPRQPAKSETSKTVQVIVLSGPQRRKQGFASAVGSLQPAENEECFIYPSGNERVAYGAFSEYMMDAFREKLYVGDSKGAAAFLAIEQIFIVDPGTRGYCIERLLGMLRIRVLQGKHRGKLLYFREDGPMVVDKKTTGDAVNSMGAMPPSLPLKPKGVE